MNVVVLDQDVLRGFTDVNPVAVEPAETVDPIAANNSAVNVVVVDGIGVDGVVAAKIAAFNQGVGGVLDVDEVAGDFCVQRAVSQDYRTVLGEDRKTRVMDVDVIKRQLGVITGNSPFCILWMRPFGSIANV